MDEDGQGRTRTHAHAHAAHAPVHSQIPRMRNDTHTNAHSKGYHENGLDSSSKNGKNTRSAEPPDNTTRSKQMERGFETFVMTGDMIIRTTPSLHKTEMARKPSSEKTTKKGGSGGSSPSKTAELGKPTTDSSKQQQTQGSPSKKHKAESRIPMPSKSRIPKPPSQRSSPKHSVKESPKPTRTQLAFPRGDWTPTALTASQELTQIENLELVNNNVISDMTKVDDTVEPQEVEPVLQEAPSTPIHEEQLKQQLEELVTPQPQFPEQAETVSEPEPEPEHPEFPERAELETWVRPESCVVSHAVPEPVQSQPLPQVESPEPIFELELEKQVGLQPVMASHPVACEATNYDFDMPSRSSAAPVGYFSFAGYRFPDVELELDIPPDDISSEDDNYRNLDSLVDVDDLPPPPDELLHDYMEKPEELPHDNTSRNLYPVGGLVTREDSLSLASTRTEQASSATRSPLHSPIVDAQLFFNGAHKTLYEPTSLETVVETEGLTTYSREVTSSIPVPPRHARHLVISKSAEKISYGRCPTVRYPPSTAMGQGIRGTKSQENYLECTADGLALVDIDFDESMASSVDALHYNKTSSTSLDTVSMPGHVPMHEAYTPEASRSLDSSPERRVDKYGERIIMPTFINLEEPRSITKLKEGGKMRSRGNVDDKIELHKGVFSQDVPGAPQQEVTSQQEQEDSLDPEEEVSSSSKVGPREVGQAVGEDAEDAAAPPTARLLDKQNVLSSVGSSSASPKRETAAKALDDSDNRRYIVTKLEIRGITQGSSSTDPVVLGVGEKAGRLSGASPPTGRGGGQRERGEEEEEIEDSPWLEDVQEEAGGTSEQHHPAPASVQGVLAGSTPAQAYLDIDPLEMYPSGSGPDGGGESDSDSIYHQPIKEVDRPSAARLAKRLFHNDGFKKTDISRHLHKK